METAAAFDPAQPFVFSLPSQSSAQLPGPATDITSHHFRTGSYRYVHLLAVRSLFLIIMDPKALRSGILLIICIALPLVIGMIGSFFTAGNIPTWYAALNKPAFNPPAWVFGPVWTILYILMGISLYLILQKGIDKPMVRQGVILFAVQLALNLLWSIIFFGMHAIFFAFVEIIMLIVVLVATMAVFFRVSKRAGWMLLPYLCWLGFASVLNATIWIIN